MLTPEPHAPTLSRQRLRAMAARAFDLFMAIATVTALNFMAWLNLRTLGLIPETSFSLETPVWDNMVRFRLLAAGMGCNIVAVLLLVALRRRVLMPWRQLRHIVRHASQSISEEREAQELRLISVRELAGSIARFASSAQDAYTRCRALQHELDESRQMLAQIVAQHQVALMSTNRELVEQYRSVLAYANYLDEHIRSHRGDTQLCYDFDDVCESGFNLKLIAQSLELLRLNQHALAPSLERQVMKLSTAGVENDVVATCDIQLLSHALWMMLLGTIRYAAAESTLRLRCIAGKNGQAIISIGISELEPGQLSPDEGHAHLLRQLQHTSPHMFAETIRSHANA